MLDTRRALRDTVASHGVGFSRTSVRTSTPYFSALQLESSVTSSRPLRYLSLAAAALATLGGTALACNARKSGASDVVRVLRLSATRWRVCVPEYVTTRVANGIGFCAAGISVPAAGAITGVTSLSMFATANGSTMARYRWARDAAIARSFQGVQPGNWTGFFGRASGPIAAGTANMLCFGVSTASSATFADVERALKASTIGTDESNATRGLRGTVRALFTPKAVLAEDWAFNAKVLHNARHTTASARITRGTRNFVYSMQPRAFRLGQGAATGWSTVLQDQNIATSEVVEMGFVQYAGTGPDLSANGTLTNVKFTLFGVGSGVGAFRYTLTTAQKVPVGAQSGIRIILPAPRAWPGDSVGVHIQSGSATKVAPAKRQQWTFGRSSTTPVAWLERGSTLRTGGLYDRSTTQIFVESNAYGANERLFGPEAIYPIASRGDKLGFQVRDQRFAGDFAMIMVSPGYRATPAATPFGLALIQNLVTFGVVQLNAAGSGATPAVPVPAGLRLAVQTAVLDFSTLAIEFGDAARVEVQ